MGFLGLKRYQIARGSEDTVTYPFVLSVILEEALLKHK